MSFCCSFTLLKHSKWLQNRKNHTDFFFFMKCVFMMTFYIEKSNPDFMTGFTAPATLHQENKFDSSSNRKSCSSKNSNSKTLLIPPSTLFSFACSLLRLPHLLWLRHVAQCGAPAPAAEPCEQRQRAAQRQEKQRACCGNGSRKDQSVLKIDQLILGLCRATRAAVRLPALSLCTS